MKVFISWSGQRSNQVALAFKEWLPSVIQALVPYVSSEDIDKGARWSSDIAKELEDSTFGILCVTKDNIDAPWLCFEAGALSKSIDRSLVIPFLLDVKRSEIDGPILQFQSALFEKDEIRKLMKSLNRACDSGGLTESMFEKAFDVWYPKLEEKLNAICKAPGECNERDEPDDGQNELLEEILEISRTNQLLLRNPDNKITEAIDEMRTGIRMLTDRNRSLPDDAGRKRTGPSIRRRTLHELETEVLPRLDAATRFHVLIGMVRDCYPWIYAYGRHILDLSSEKADKGARVEALASFEHLIRLGCEDPALLGDRAIQRRDDIILLRDLSTNLVLAGEELLMRPLFEDH